MGLDIGGSINNTSEWLCNKSYLSSTIRNPFSAALLITVIVVIIILANYSLLDGSREERVRLVKTSIYIYLGIMTFLFMHYSSITDCVQERYKNQESEDIMENISNLNSTAPEISPFEGYTVSSTSYTEVSEKTISGAGESDTHSVDLKNPNIPSLSTL